MALYNVEYHSMTTHFRQSYSEETNINELELIQTLAIVVDPSKLSLKGDISISELLLQENIGLKKSVISNKGNVFVELTTEEIDVNTLLDNDQNIVSPKFYEIIDNYLVYPLTTDPIDITLNLDHINFSLVNYPSELITHRYQVGYGDEKGGVLTEIKNLESNPVSIMFMDYLPWFLPIYFSTLSFNINDKFLSLEEIAEDYVFEPSEDHGKPSLIKMKLTIPASSTLKISYKFKKTFLIWTEHPPDAHRGFDIVSAVITPLDSTHNKCGLDWNPLNNNKKENQNKKISIYTEALLISLPTPDFSMPYNVITLTSTMLALFYGTILSLLTRKLDYLKKGKAPDTNRLFVRFIKFFFSFPPLSFLIKNKKNHDKDNDKNKDEENDKDKNHNDTTNTNKTKKE
eukprot:TRINITY_DN5390_c0_g1_i1.p1 TRINITY_DN5390_c0_g1~~TRINITY_DN5390_c0_g1_i1.p1  ORF type:complete len:401 (+),score=116.93 TRINITY_DN5390_c0_g1_i1:745-1947(+)